MSSVKILLSSTALQQKLYPIVKEDFEYNPVLISVHNGKLLINDHELDVEANASSFSGEYPLSKIRQLYNILKTVSDQPITIKLGYSDWLEIHNLTI